MRTVAIAAIAALLFSLAVSAQTTRAGRLVPFPSDTISNDPTKGPDAFIDYANPVQVAGTLTRATLYWVNAPTTPCQQAVRFKVLRPDVAFGTYTVLGDIGPFPGVNGWSFININPPIAVQPYDVIAIVQLQSLRTCGGVAFGRPFGRAMTVHVGNDLSSGTLGSASIDPTLQPEIFAASSDPAITSVIPAAGAAAGNFGSFFRTSLQLQNASKSVISGKLVFHPIGTAGNINTDPSVNFVVASQSSISFADVITAMGQSGIGSLDVVTVGGTPLIVTARVFNDLGSAGTSGATEDGVSPEEALLPSFNGFLPIPSDLTNYRMNLGLRTLDNGATIAFNLFDGRGNFQGVITKTFPPHWFEQQGAAGYANVALPADGRFQIQVTSGSAIVYASVTDNRTNDTSIRYAKQ